MGEDQAGNGGTSNELRTQNTSVSVCREEPHTDRHSQHMKVTGRATMGRTGINSLRHMEYRYLSLTLIMNPCMELLDAHTHTGEEQNEKASSIIQ